MLERKSRDEIEVANLDRLKRRLGLLRSEDRTAPVRESYPVFYEYRAQILEQDQTVREKFFLELDARAEYLAKGKIIKEEDEFVFGLIESIKTHYKKCKQEEKDKIYTDVKTLFTCAIEYKRGTM